MVVAWWKELVVESSSLHVVSECNELSANCLKTQKAALCGLPFNNGRKTALLRGLDKKDGGYAIYNGCDRNKQLRHSRQANSCMLVDFDTGYTIVSFLKDYMECQLEYLNSLD